jgi:hypothetical protein
LTDFSNVTKGLWTVTAGVIPYHPEEHVTRQWRYTAIDYENDQKTDPEIMTRFDQIVEEVKQYQTELTNPAFFNWVHADFYWV